MTGLMPAKITPDLCVLRYRISTGSPECQAHFDQGLAYYYSYVWMEAARCFETAIHLDPDCPMAWWGLSRALEKYGRRDLVNKALQKADELKARAGWREQQLILASMQVKGLAPNVGDAEARKKAKPHSTSGNAHSRRWRSASTGSSSPRSVTSAATSETSEANSTTSSPSTRHDLFSAAFPPT